MNVFEAHREEMVERQLIARGIRDIGVLEAMRTVPREQFVPVSRRKVAYADCPLPIGNGQTISQPYIVAFMAELLELSPSDQVLDVGTGSGYAAAVMSRIARMIFSIERHVGLANAAIICFKRMGIENIRVQHGDGTQGWAEYAPFNAIMVAASAPRIPSAFEEQLATGGRLVLPVGDNPYCQHLLRIRKTGPRSFKKEDLGWVQFVPLVGDEGWPEEDTQE